MKKNKLWIILFTIIVVILVIILYCFINKNNIPIVHSTSTKTENSQIYMDSETNSSNKDTSSNTFIRPKVVTDYDKFYTVEKCITQYLNTININNPRYYIYDEETGENIRNYSEEDLAKNIINLLSSDYISNKSINLDNVYNIIDITMEDSLFTPLQMKMLSNSTIEKYIVYGLISTMQDELKDDIYIIVNLDTSNHTFSIEPLNDNYSNIDDINISSISINDIEENNYNKYITEYMDIESICQKYFSIYKRLTKIKPEFLYNSFSDEYKKQRFPTLENFQDYLQKNSEEISSLQYIKYSQKNNTYSFKDQYENVYTFTVTSPMDFSLQLDEYTILSNSSKLKYYSSNNKNKVEVNAKNWIQMLNNRDYYSAFNHLDTSFKESNWHSLDDFSKDITKRFPDHYTIEYSDFSENTTNCYNQTIILKSIENNDITITLAMKINLESNYNFSLSFI